MKKMNRRKFIGTAWAGAGATFLSPGVVSGNAVGKQEAGSSMKTKKIIVVGAGISGLCCAYELQKKGHEVTVLEATGRHGGHVFTTRDGLTDGLYADLGADHITKPGYERFFDYTREFNLPVLAYPHAEGSDAAPGRHALKMIDGRFYSETELADAAVLRRFGFNEREVQFLTSHPWYELRLFFVKKYLAHFKMENQPFGIGLDDLDQISFAELFKREGASPTALRFLGGQQTSALYGLWRLASMSFRGIPQSEGETFRLKGGNQELPNAFAKKLGDRVRLRHPIQSIAHGPDGVTVSYTAHGYTEEKKMTADFLVNCTSLQVFRQIPVTPALSPEKQYVVDNLAYSSHPFYVFEASTKFWLDDGLKSINLEFEHPDISSIWQEPNEIETNRIILKAYGPGGLSPQRVLAAFRKLYPGKQDTIVEGVTRDWTQDKYSPSCEMEPIPVGELHKFWPQVVLPEGRIYFAGTYADNLSRGMESCLRSANRVAYEIDQR